MTADTNLVRNVVTIKVIREEEEEGGERHMPYEEASRTVSTTF